MWSGSNTRASITNGWVKRSVPIASRRAERIGIAEKRLARRSRCHPAHGRDVNEAWRNHTAIECQAHAPYARFLALTFGITRREKRSVFTVQLIDLLNLQNSMSV